MREPKYPDSAPQHSYEDEVAASRARVDARGGRPDWDALRQEVRLAILASTPRRGRPKKAPHA